MNQTDHFANVRGEQFMVLTTFRRDGGGVPTTVWFAEADGTLYVTTARTAGKTKRISTNGRVTVAPSDRAGNVQGPAVAAQARILGSDEDQPAIDHLRRKYGAMYDSLTAQMDRERPDNQRVFLEIVPA